QASSEDTSEGDNSADFDNALTPERPTELPICTDDERALFLEGLSTLTKTERAIYDLYLDDRNTQEILDHLEITSNTLKFHNKNLYTKLGVSSRKRLVAIARHLQ
ncbi:MAG: helix-turn-helix transcriptional regulator, partial [Eggerthellaceae bacterium]|nr:helix-turn-helix transcriptional regulator [Eggerthellaceae bacterium]